MYDAWISILSFLSKVLPLVIASLLPVIGDQHLIIGGLIAIEAGLVAFQKWLEKKDKDVAFQRK